MLRIAQLESLGGCVAAMTDAADGDCRRDAEDTAPRDAALAGIGHSAQSFVCVRQVHGDRIVRVDDVSSMELGDADALITNVPGIALGITVADCIPVFLVAPGGAVGLAHAGREGTRLGIAGKMVQSMIHAFGTRPGQLRAFIGPGAGPCCYEVSREIAENWRQAGLPTVGQHLDLWRANHRSLEDAGISARLIRISGHCTICRGRYFSYRREATAARNLALLSILKQ